MSQSFCRSNKISLHLDSSERKLNGFILCWVLKKIFYVFLTHYTGKTCLFIKRTEHVVGRKRIVITNSHTNCPINSKLPLTPERRTILFKISVDCRIFILQNIFSSIELLRDFQILANTCCATFIVRLLCEGGDLL